MAIESFDTALQNAGRVPTNADNTADTSRSATSILPSSFTTAVAAKTAATTAPQNATAAPTGSTNETFVGLVDALNKWQQDLAKSKPGYIPDVYEIKFDPADMVNLKVKKPGGVDKKAVAQQKADPNGKYLDPASNRVNNNSQTIQIPAGKQVVQIIEELMRSSEYVFNQQSSVIDTDGKTVPNPNASGSNTAWFKVTAQVTPIGTKMDPTRNAWPNKITYVISPFSVATANSEYFPPVKYRGVHKSYNYWFTGQNTQILDYEQTYNALYYLTLSDQSGVALANEARLVDSRELQQRMFATRSGEADAGSKSNEPGANLAEALYNASDFIKINLRIVGDPAWLQQGSDAMGGATQGINFKPFNPDGTINFDAGQVMFDVSWNRPTDYNFAKGIAEVTGKNVQSGGQSLPQENQTYQALRCRSIFRGGRFEQELSGALAVGFAAPSQSAPSSTTASKPPPVASAAPATAINQPNSLKTAQDLKNAVVGDAKAVVNYLRDPLQNIAADGRSSSDKAPNAPNSTPASDSQNPPALPAAPPAPATSNGSVAQVPAPNNTILTANGVQLIFNSASALEAYQNNRLRTDSGINLGEGTRLPQKLAKDE
jgi:hypothetical protein